MSTRRAGWALALLLALATGVRMRWFTGLQMGDDVVYSKITVDRLHGTTHVLNVHQTRSGFLLALLGSYALFGPGEVPLVLYNLLCSVGLVGALFALGRRLFGDAAGISAGAIAALHPNLVRFASECHTDTPVALWLTLALYGLLAAEGSPRPRRLLVLSGLLIGWAWLHKEHAVFALPFLLGHGVAARRGWAWGLPAALAFAGVLGAELAGFAVLTDSPFKRFEMLRTWHAEIYMAEQYPSIGSRVYRLTLDLPLRLLAPVHGLVFPAGLAAAWLCRRDARALRVAGWFLALYAGYSAWPSSWVPFRPGFTLHAWTFPLLWPPLILLTAAALSKLRPRPAAALLLLLSGIHLAAIHQAWTRDRRLADGPREAWAWLRREGPARVFADRKTLEAFDFWDGHDPSRRYFAPEDPEPVAAGAVVVDRLLTEPGRWWSQRPPSAPPGWTTSYESPRLHILTSPHR